MPQHVSTVICRSPCPCGSAGREVRPHRPATSYESKPARRVGALEKRGTPEGPVGRSFSEMLRAASRLRTVLAPFGKLGPEVRTRPCSKHAGDSPGGDKTTSKSPSKSPSKRARQEEPVRKKWHEQVMPLAALPAKSCEGSRVTGWLERTDETTEAKRDRGQRNR